VGRLRCAVVAQIPLFRIDKIWTVCGVEETDEPGWDQVLFVSPKQVPTPVAWYDITEFLLVEGFASIVGAPGWDTTSSGFYTGGTRVVHRPTIEAILGLLGLTQFDGDTADSRVDIE